MAKKSGKDAAAADKRQPSRRALPYVLLFLVLQVVSYAVVLRVVQPDTPGREVSFAQLNSMLSKGELREATVLDYDSRVTSSDDLGDFWVALPRGELSVNQMSGALAASGVETTIDQQGYKGTLSFLAQFLLPVLLFFTMFGVLFLLFTGSSGLGGLSMFGKSKARRFQEDGVRLTFADVAGLDETIEELAEVKDFLADPHRFAAMGARAPKGVLLVGPPGCGKTLLAKALAGEAGVPFYSVAGSEFVEMLVGVGASRVRDLFATARANAPAIIFIDELDAVGRARSSSAFGANEERDQTLNEMLVQMDGFGPETGLVVLTATNRADILDEALTRPGRFDRRIVVDLPDQAGREAILAVHLKGKPIGPDVQVAQVARRTPGFSGADLANVVNEGALLASRRGLNAIGRAEIEEGIDRALSGPERRNRLLTPRDKRMVAVHEAGHALVGWLLPGAEGVEKVSVVARGMSLGHTRILPAEETKLLTRSQLLDRITTAAAGRLAEVEVFGEASTGAAQDLVVATDLARQMVFDLGMGEGVTARSYRSGPYGADSSAVSAALADQLDNAVAALLGEAEDRARRVLSEHRPWLDGLVSALEERETLHRDDIDALLNAMAQPEADSPLPTADPATVPARSE